MIVSGDTTDLIIGLIIDIRSRLSFQAAGVTATADHNSLLNLTAGNAHPQYLRVDGTEPMLGNLDMNGSLIADVLTVNGVVVETHAARHLPGGADALTTGVASTIGTVNQEGILASYSRQDHVHNHGAQTDPTLHAVATGGANGFMSSTDKTKIDATGAPVSVGTANSIGVASSFALSDHVHNHGAQTDPTLHAVATGGANGFMSSTDKTKIDAATASNTVGTLVLRDGSGGTAIQTLNIKTGASFDNIFQPSGSQTGNVTYTLPIDDGTASQVLTSNGSGVLSWTSTLSNPTTTTGDMIYSSPGSTLVRLAIGTQGQNVRTGSAGLPVWLDYVVPSTESRLFDDFTGTVTPFGDTPWTATGNGAGNSVTALAVISPADTRVYGAVVLDKGTAITGRQSLNKSSTSVFLGFGTFYFEAGVMIPTIPDVTNNFIVRVGLGDSSTNTESTDAVYFLIDRTVSTTNWCLRTISNGSSTTSVSSATFSSGAWQRLGFLVNAAGTLVTFTIGGSSVGTSAATIPTGSLRLCGMFAQIIGVLAAIVARTLQIDYMSYSAQFTAVRY